MQDRNKKKMLPVSQRAASIHNYMTTIQKKILSNEQVSQRSKMSGSVACSCGGGRTYQTTFSCILYGAKTVARVRSPWVANFVAPKCSFLNYQRKRRDNDLYYRISVISASQKVYIKVSQSSVFVVSSARLVSGIDTNK